MAAKTARVKRAEGKASKAKIKTGTTKKARVKRAVRKTAPTARVGVGIDPNIGADPEALKGVDFNIGAKIPTGAVPTAKIPLGEALDVAPPFIGANIYDESIGYGAALPGEAGTLAVERIKSERATRRSKVSRK